MIHLRLRSAGVLMLGLLLAAAAASAAPPGGATTPAAARARATGPASGTRGDAPAPALPGEQKLRYGPFGEVTVYRPAAKVGSVALFISGDGGWNLGVVDMARHLLEQDAIVVGIDIRHYLAAVNAPSASCRNFAVDFEGLAHEVEGRLKLAEYLPPVLVGYSSGATLAYATAVESPKGTFAGALSMGFCPDLEVTQKVCSGSGLHYDWQYAKQPLPPPVTGLMFTAAAANQTPWVAFQGEIDQVCDAKGTREFVAKTGSAELVWLPKVGHGFSVERNWLPQFRASYRKLAAHATLQRATVPEVQDLPLVEVPAGAAPSAESQLFAVLLTGDGGWAGIDQDVAGAIAASGVPVVGLNSLKYFWTARTPEAAARDLERVIRRYAAAWQRPQVLLIGYSFGADVLPFLYNRLAEDVRASVRSVSLLGLSDTATFEFHVADWIPGAGESGHPTAPEIRRMGTARVLCVHGTDEGASPCQQLTGPTVKTAVLAGGHHFGGDYAALAKLIVEFARSGQ